MKIEDLKLQVVPEGQELELQPVDEKISIDSDKE